MGKKQKKVKATENKVIIGGFEFLFEKEVTGFRCTHFLYRSVKGGYLVSFTNIDVELGDVESKKGRSKKCVR